MLERLVGFVLRHLPPSAGGIDPQNPQAFLDRNSSQAADLSVTLHGGWYARLANITQEARRHPRAFEIIGDNGEIGYDLMVRDCIRREFQMRGHEIHTEVIQRLQWGAEGHSDALTTLARSCWDLEKAMNT